MIPGAEGVMPFTNIAELAAAQQQQERPVETVAPEPMIEPTPDQYDHALRVAHMAINMLNRNEMLSEITLTADQAQGVVGREHPVTVHFSAHRPGPRVVSVSIGSLPPFAVPTHWLPEAPPVPSPPEEGPEQS